MGSSQLEINLAKSAALDIRFLLKTCNLSMTFFLFTGETKKSCTWAPRLLRIFQISTRRISYPNFKIQIGIWNSGKHGSDIATPWKRPYFHGSYLLQALPMHTPITFLQLIMSKFPESLWSQKPPRLKFQLLTHSKARVQRSGWPWSARIPPSLSVTCSGWLPSLHLRCRPTHPSEI